MVGRIYNFMNRAFICVEQETSSKEHVISLVITKFKLTFTTS